MLTQISSVTYGVQISAIFTLMAITTENNLFSTVRTEITAQCAGYDLLRRIRTRNIGPYFVEDEAHNPLTVNQERYKEIIIAPFVRDLKQFCRARSLPLRRQWMQQDGATDHTAGESLASLQQHLGDRLISRGTEFPFPSHSPDLTALDSYIWDMFSDQMTHLEMFSNYGRRYSHVLATTRVHQHVQQSKGPL